MAQNLDDVAGADNDRVHKIEINSKYLLTPRSFILIGIFVLSVIAFIFINSTTWCSVKYTCLIPGYTITYSYYSSTMCTTFLLSLFSYGFYAMSLDKLISQIFTKIKENHWFLIDFSVSSLNTVFLFIAVVLMSARTGRRPAFQGATVSGSFCFIASVVRLYFMSREIRSNDNGQNFEIHHNTNTREPSVDLQFNSDNQSNSSFSSKASSNSLESIETEIPGAWKNLEDNQSSQNHTVEVDFK